MPNRKPTGTWNSASHIWDLFKCIISCVWCDWITIVKMTEGTTAENVNLMTSQNRFHSKSVASYLFAGVYFFNGQVWLHTFVLQSMICRKCRGSAKENFSVTSIGDLVEYFSWGCISCYSNQYYIYVAYLVLYNQYHEFIIYLYGVGRTTGGPKCGPTGGPTDGITKSSKLVQRWLS